MKRVGYTNTDFTNSLIYARMRLLHDKTMELKKTNSNEKNKAEPPTVVLQDLGFRFNLKFVLYLLWLGLKSKNWERLSPNLAKPQNVSSYCKRT